MFSCVHMCVPVCRGSQRPTTGSLPSLHLTFQHSISHWSWLELTSWLGGLDSKLPRSSCLCLPDAAVLEKPLHSDPFFPPFMPLSLLRTLCMRMVCFDHVPHSNCSKSSPILSIISSQLHLYGFCFVVVVAPSPLFVCVEGHLLAHR